ncbi:dUTP diphosphatase [Selenomonas bovis]|uniref:dUTP diphosphatase n=1 Tax=Selenomonas bovis TaxID=416586 RepID=A0A848B808_9FIRM|nr:dUTP diphosphatase [Selenomonas bovis]NMD98095.1 dUTP diphosphatase [Selenomonas bovis]
MKQRGFEVVTAYAGQGIALPQRKTAASAGYDLAAAADTVLSPGRVTLVPTGLKAYMQPGEVLCISIRSSMALRQSLLLANGIGVIDADYYGNEQNEGHIQVAVLNLGTSPLTVHKGERLAQGIFSHYLVTDDDAAGGIRKGGFGSTGRG